MLGKEFIDSIFFSHIKGKYKVSHGEAARDIEAVGEELRKEQKEPSPELILNKLKDKYKGREVV
jgi:hypothetical protein